MKEKQPAVSPCFTTGRILIIAALAVGGFFAKPTLAGEHPVPPPTDTSVRYSITDLGLIPPIADDVEVSENQSGEIAYWQKMPDGSVQACTWQKGKVRVIGTLPGDASSITHDLNNHGDLVGWSVPLKMLVNTLNTVHAFSWHRGRLTSLGTLGGKDSMAFGINDEGVVVGTSNIGPNVGRTDKHAFMFKDGKITDLGTLPNQPFSEAKAINDAGVIAGTCQYDPIHVHAVLWTSTGIVDLGTLPGGQNSRAQAINTQGDVCGLSDVAHGTGKAFLYTAGHMIDLGDLGDDPTRANDLNDSDQVVGNASISEHVFDAFLWEKGTMEDLNNLIPKDSGWHIRQAYAINNKGEIVCEGTQELYKEHLLLLEPLANAAP
jgi:probable HAF family extracellular repeat protein